MQDNFLCYRILYPTYLVAGHFATLSFLHIYNILLRSIAMQVSIKFLRPGMQLISDVLTKEGNLLIPGGIILNEYYINKLVEFGISRVDVSGGGVYDEYSLNFDENYKLAVERLNVVFSYAKYKNSVDMTECFGIVESLIGNSKLGRNLLSYMKTNDKPYDYFLQHSVNVCILSVLMGTWMGYDSVNLKILGVSALLHDIGKIKIPDDIVNKPGKLTPDEYVIVKNHTRYGFQILKETASLDEVIRSAALAHHERMDGKGYPFGLLGTVLNEKVRIISICDVYDAITSDKPYKRKQNPLKGFKIIFDSSFKGLDPYLCKVFLNNGVPAFQGCSAALNDGRVGRIIRISAEKPVKPWIVTDNEFINMERHNGLEIEKVF